VQEQVSKVLDLIFAPESNLISIRFVRHSPGRRRGSEVTMYDVNCGSAVQGGLVRSTFAKYRRRDNPVPRPPELKDVNIHPLVCSILLINLACINFVISPFSKFLTQEIFIFYRYYFIPIITFFWVSESLL